VLALVGALAVAGCLGAGPGGETLEAADAGTDTPDDGRATRHGPGVDEAERPDEAPGDPTWAATGHQGAEPTVGITDAGTLLATADHVLVCSTDGGTSWEVVTAIGEEAEGTPADTAYRSWDPLMYVDEVTDVVYMDPMFPPLRTELQFSTDDGDAWTQNPPACHPPPMDHQTFFTAVPGPQAPDQAGAVHETVLYQCYNALSSTKCAVSYDDGQTWPVAEPVADRETGDCGGVNGFGGGAPDGTAVVPLQSGCEEPTIAVTEDSGLAWELHAVPEPTGVASVDPEVAYDEEGPLYLVWRAGDETSSPAATTTA
jgi:hypothetical protein